MIQLIVGSKGKGKTKILLEKAAQAIKEADGTVVFVDKSSQHMYELSNKIRLINVSDYPVDDEKSFIGFISGIFSQDHDLEYLFVDSFLKVADLYDKDITNCIRVLAKLADARKVTVVISLSMDEHALPEACKEYVAVSL